MGDTAENTEEQVNVDPGTARANRFYGEGLAAHEQKTEDQDNESPAKADQDDAVMPDAATPDAADATDNADENTDNDAKKSGDESGEVEITTVEELAEHLKADPDWLPTLKITRKINGKDVEVSIADALETHDKVAAADDYLANAKAQAKETLAKNEEQTQELGASVNALGNLLKLVEEELVRDVNAINWADLREKDPAEWSAKQTELKERKAKIDQIKAASVDALKNLAEKDDVVDTARLAEKLPAERKKLIAKVPEWKDDEVRKREAREVVEFMDAEGYSETDQKYIMHSGRDLAIAVKAMRYDRLIEKAERESKDKEVVKVPRMLKPGPDKSDKAKATPAEKADRVAILYGS